jgi:hypothetical protein
MPPYGSHAKPLSDSTCSRSLATDGENSNTNGSLFILIASCFQDERWEGRKHCLFPRSIDAPIDEHRLTVTVLTQIDALFWHDAEGTNHLQTVLATPGRTTKSHSVTDAASARTSSLRRSR